ncbi:MAG: site-specific DNA-methyltransferase [Anaerovoracaceae bacterium]
MNLVFALPCILEESRIEYERIKKLSLGEKSFFPVEKVIHKGATVGNLLAHGDNLDFINYLCNQKNMEGKIQLIYMDPPFYSKANYEAAIKFNSDKVKDIPLIKPLAYKDSWQNGIEEYLKTICVRFYLMKDLLSDTGCFWVHLDWHVVHYVKILMDEIFGEKRFVNEVVWNYKSGGTGKRSFSKKHDTLLFYSKTKDYYFSPQKEKSYNRGFKPYRFKGVKEYKDDLGWYTMVNMKDVWPIDMVGRTSSERTGYATQKPEALLRRIVDSCSAPGDICADFFGGSATLASVCEKEGRRWISCDIGGIATVNGLKRMSGKKSTFTLLQEGKTIGKKGKGEVNLEVTAKPIEFTEKKLITIRLKDYNIKSRDIPLVGKEKEKIKALVKKDPLKLIEYWSVDFSYDGNIHTPQMFFTKQDHQVIVECENIVKGDECLSVRTVDVFGNSTFTLVDLGGGNDD